jgi:hypothetical protein
MHSKIKTSKNQTFDIFSGFQFQSVVVILGNYQTELLQAKIQQIEMLT